MKPPGYSLAHSSPFLATRWHRPGDQTECRHIRSLRPHDLWKTSWGPMQIGDKEFRDFIKPSAESEMLHVMIQLICIVHRVSRACKMKGSLRCSRRDHREITTIAFSACVALGPRQGCRHQVLLPVRWTVLASKAVDCERNTHDAWTECDEWTLRFQGDAML